MAEEGWTSERIREFADALKLTTSLGFVDDQLCVQVKKPEGPNKAFESLVGMMLRDGVECCDLGGTGCRVIPAGPKPVQSGRAPSAPSASELVQLVLQAEADGLIVQIADVFKVGFVTVSKGWRRADQVLTFARFEQRLQDSGIHYEKYDATTWGGENLSQIKIPCTVVALPTVTK